MKSLYEMYERNEEIELSGVPFGVGESTFWLKRLGGSNSTKQAEILSKISKPYAAAIRTNNLPAEIANKVEAKFLALACFVKMEDVKDRSGNIIESTVENFTTLMTELPELRSLLQNNAEDMSNFKDQSSEEEVAELGNS